MGKLTNTQRAAIFQAWKDGTTPKELAKQYGVSDQAIYNLVKKMAKEPPQELEDVENGIPNTPLVPAEIEKEISAIAEKNSTNAEPDMLPIYITDVLSEHISSLSMEIEEREQRIAELQAEIEDYQFEREKIAAWLEAHT